HVAVSEGRVSVRLNGRPTISLGAGQAWDAEPAPPSSALELAASGAATLTPAAGPRPAAAKDGARAPARSEKPVPQARSSAALEAPVAPAPSAQDSLPAPSTQGTKAEDDAYLHIVDLLREAKDAEARARAKDYLLRFPNGFRRIEVLNIATRGARDAGADIAVDALQ
ncbi:MAG TPA: hypothetical protein VGF76_26220, partial [Polyangiaceae bacterium]